MGLDKTDTECWWFRHTGSNGSIMYSHLFADKDSLIAFVHDHILSRSRDMGHGTIMIVDAALADGFLANAARAIQHAVKEDICWGRGHLMTYVNDDTLEVIHASLVRERVRG